MEMTGPLAFPVQCEVPANDAATACSTRSDCIVCKNSALYSGSLAQGPRPVTPWTDTLQVHVYTDSLNGWGSLPVFGPAIGNPGMTPQMFDPPPNDLLFLAIRSIINGQ
jgi:hypothetical protein